MTFAGNPVLSTPNGARLERAIEDLEFYVAVDSALNETTRHADLILPPTSALERDHYDLAFHNLAVRNTTKYGPPVLVPPKDARHDWQILHSLALRLAVHKKRGLNERIPLVAMGALGPQGLLDLGLRAGPYGAFRRPLAGLTLARVRKNAHGIDLGALVPCLPERLMTPGRRIALAPPALLADITRVEELLRAPTGGLLLIGRRELRSNNSWMHNVPRLAKGPVTCTLLMHPEDARTRALADGQDVRLASKVGSIVVPLEVSDEMMPGVVSLPHGWGHGRGGTRLSVANARPGASINDVTEDARIDELTGNAAFSATPVTVEAA